MAYNYIKFLNAVDLSTSNVCAHVPAWYYRTSLSLSELLNLYAKYIEGLTYILHYRETELCLSFEILCKK